MKYLKYSGKIVFLILGFLSGLSIIGAIVGFIIGHLVDIVLYKKYLMSLLKNILNKKITKLEKNEYLNIKDITLLLISAYTIIYFKKFLSIKENTKKLIAVKNSIIICFNEPSLTESIFEYILNKKGEIDLEYFSRIIKESAFNYLRMTIFESIIKTGMLYDKKFINYNLTSLKTTASFLDIPETEITNLKYKFMPEGLIDYKILGINPDASVDEIRKTYRKLTSYFHPDNAVNLDNEHQEQTNEAFLRIQEAYRNVLRDKSS